MNLKSLIYEKIKRNNFFTNKKTIYFALTSITMQQTLNTSDRDGDQSDNINYGVSKERLIYIYL